MFAVIVTQGGGTVFSQNTFRTYGPFKSRAEVQKWVRVFNNPALAGEAWKVVKLEKPPVLVNPMPID